MFVRSKKSVSGRVIPVHMLINTILQKCDGNRPKCNQCIRSGKEAECEYGDRPAPNATRVLEGQIAYIENRIRELERNRSHTHQQSLHPTDPPPEVAQYLYVHIDRLAFSK